MDTLKQVMRKAIGFICYRDQIALRTTCRDMCMIVDSFEMRMDSTRYVYNVSPKYGMINNFEFIAKTCMPYWNAYDSIEKLKRSVVVGYYDYHYVSYDSVQYNQLVDKKPVNTGNLYYRGVLCFKDCGISLNLRDKYPRLKVGNLFVHDIKLYVRGFAYPIFRLVFGSLHSDLVIKEMEINTQIPTSYLVISLCIRK